MSNFFNQDSVLRFRGRSSRHSPLFKLVNGLHNLKLRNKFVVQFCGLVGRHHFPPKNYYFLSRNVVRKKIFSFTMHPTTACPSDAYDCGLQCLYKILKRFRSCRQTIYSILSCKFHWACQVKTKGQFCRFQIRAFRQKISVNSSAG